MNGIENIIFDFGGVIIDIDPQRTVNAFRGLGVQNIEQLYSECYQSNLFDELEKGSITDAEFRDRIRNISNLPLTDVQIDFAWNEILIGIPKEKIDFLKRIKKDYRLFLLSNTNEIHEVAYTQLILDKFNENIFKTVFEEAYFSHRLKMLKPDSEIFRYVLDKNDIEAERTLFIDDTLRHIEGAKKVGLKTFYFEKGKTFEDILK